MQRSFFRQLDAARRAVDVASLKSVPYGLHQRAIIAREIVHPMRQNVSMRYEDANVFVETVVWTDRRERWLFRLSAWTSLSVPLDVVVFWSPACSFARGFDNVPQLYVGDDGAAEAFATVQHGIEQWLGVGVDPVTNPTRPVVIDPSPDDTLPAYSTSAIFGSPQKKSFGTQTTECCPPA